MTRIHSGDKEVTTAIYSYLEMMMVTRCQPSATRLFLRLGKPETADQWTKRRRKEWIKEHSFKATLTSTIQKLELTEWHQNNPLKKCLARQTPYQWLGKKQITQE